MRILFVCRMLPHSEVRDSGRLDTYHYIAALSEDHEVSLITFVPPEDEGGVKIMRGLCRIVVAVPYRHDGLGIRLYRAWWRLLQTKIYGRNHSVAYTRALRELVTLHDFDVAIVDGMMAEYGRLLTHIPTVLDEVDLFFAVAHQLFREESNWLHRLWLGYDWLRTTWRETKHLRTYDGVFVRSQKDELVVREFAPQQQISILPPWFEGLGELLEIPIERPFSPTLLFVGAMNTPANIGAVTFFANEVFPALVAKVPSLEFIIAGSNPSASVKALGNLPNVTVTGEVRDLTPLYAAATVVVVPLFIGGGIIVKTLNGLASGRPVVSTSVGNSGTNAQDGCDLRIVSPDPKDMVIAILELLHDEGEWLRLAENGRSFIKANYSWPRTISNMSSFLQIVASCQVV